MCTCELDRVPPAHNCLLPLPSTYGEVHNVGFSSNTSLPVGGRCWVRRLRVQQLFRKNFLLIFFQCFHIIII